MRHVVEIELEGIAGLVGPLIGKQPPDIQIWILGRWPRPSLEKKAHSIRAARSEASS
jgi:hypothetical protein